MLHPIHQYLAGHHQRKQENLPFHVLPHKVDFAHIANEDDGQEDYLVEPLHNVIARNLVDLLLAGKYDEVDQLLNQELSVE